MIMEADSAVKPVERHVGTRIRQVRERAGISLTELARQVGVSKGQISQIERGGSNPSLPVLRAIARALEVPLFTLFVFDDAHDALVRRDERQTLRVPGSEVIRELLVPDQHRRMILITARFEPGDVSAPEPSSHGGEECIVVTLGSIQVEIGDRVLLLNTGDSYYFDPTIPHRFRNVSDEPAELIAAITASA